MGTVVRELGTGKYVTLLCRLSVKSRISAKDDEVKAEFSLCLIELHAIKTYGDM
jgi:hypothetical protein